MNSKEHCKEPDRDAPNLVCGYPLPCPHHTAVIGVALDDRGDLADVDKLQRALANLRWLRGRVYISTYFLVAPCTIKTGELRPLGGSVVRVATRCTWTSDRSGVGEKPGFDTKEFVAELPLHATIVEIRNTAEEQQIEARAWLEEHYATPSQTDAIEVETTSELVLAEAQRQGIAALGYLPGCRRPQHLDGRACEGGCSEIADPAERRRAGLDLDVRRPKRGPRVRRR